MPRWGITLTRVERYVGWLEVEAPTRREARRLALSRIDEVFRWDPETSWPERVRKVEPLD
jgi:hypothetical protein